MRTVWTTLRVEGWHRWPDAPPAFAYLAASHRHLFHLRAEIPVDGYDREVSFEELRHALARAWPGPDLGARSCEALAELLADDLAALFFRAVKVEVSEDGESGGTYSTEGPG